RLSRADLAAMVRLLTVRRGRARVYAVRGDLMAFAGSIRSRAASVHPPGSEAHAADHGRSVPLRPGRPGREADRGRSGAEPAPAGNPPRNAAVVRRGAR